MNKFTAIDMETWERAAFYKLYTEEWHSIYSSMTKKLDVTALYTACKANGIKLAPALIYATGLAINERDCFKVGLSDGVLGHWDILHPLYPVRNADTDSFAFHTAPFLDSFESFYKGYLEEKEHADKNSKGMFVGDIPPNYYQISIMPATDFDSNSFSMGSYRYFFAPIVVVGTYVGTNRKILPVSITTNHATVDGYDLGKFFTSLQNYLNNPDKWLKGK